MTILVILFVLAFWKHILGGALALLALGWVIFQWLVVGGVIGWGIWWLFT